jgi:autotransporter-associated beta strand protein
MLTSTAAAGAADHPKSPAARKPAAIMTAAAAVNGTWTQAGTNTNYSNTANWNGGTVASGTDAVATITKSGPTIVVDTNETIGSISGTWNSGSSLNLSGSSGNSLTFVTSGTTPSLNLGTFYSRYDYLANLNIAGTQGLSYIGASNALVLQSGVTWTGFSGSFTLSTDTKGDGVMAYAQAANILPAVDLTMIPGTGTNGYQHAKLVLNSGANQTIGALNSTISSSGGTAYLSSYSANTVLTGGTPAGTNANGYSTLTIGSTNNSGTFLGKIGTGYNSSAKTEDATACLISIAKTGTGTQTFSGTNNYAGTTTITAGSVLVDGTHLAAAVAGSDTGKYVAGSAGTLGGTGTIKPAGSTATGGGVMVSISGKLAPGDPSVSSGVGTLTLDSGNAVKSILSLETGGTLSFNLGAKSTGSELVIANPIANDVFFNNNTINFNDLTSGGLVSGNYILVHSPLSGTFAGLTTNGSGVITAGLTIGSGLSAYVGSQLELVGNDIVLYLAPSQLPSPPANVSATAAGTQVTVTWTASTGATTYAIYRSTSPNGTYTNIAASSGTSYTDTTASNGQTYYYKIVAADSAGQSSYSSAGSATALNPGTISIISVHLRAYNNFGLAVSDLAGVDRVGYWNNLLGPVLAGETQATSSLVNHLGSAVPGVTVSFTGGKTGGSYTASGTLFLSTETTNDLDLEASAFDQYDTTPSTLSVTGIPYSNYDAIFYTYDTGTTTQGGSVTANGQTLSLRGGSGNATATGAGYVQSDDAAPASSTTQQANYVRFAGLSGNLTASLVAKNVGSATERLKFTGFQIISNVAVPAPTAVPAAPATLAAVSGNTQVGLNWTAAATATSYNVYRNGAFLSTVAAPLTSYPDIAVTNGTAYSYTVAAVNGVGAGAQSSPASATPAEPAFTLAPRSVYQYSVPLTGIFASASGTFWPADPQRRAYLWIPPGCTKVQGVIFGIHNMLEKPMFDDPAIRQACTNANLAIVFISPGDAKVWTPTTVGNYNAGPATTALDLDPNEYYSQDISSGTTHYATDINPATGARFASQAEQCGYEMAQVLGNLAVASGYAEIAYAPIMITGHSAASTFVWVRGVYNTAALIGRVFAILPYKGTYPGSCPAGIPILHTSSEYQEISNWGNTWETSDAAAMRGLRAGGTNCLIGECVQPGTGHYEYVPSQAAPLAAFIQATAAARIPANWPATGYPTLNTLDPTAGYVIDVRTLGTGSCAPIAYSQWVAAGNDPLRAYWYPDQTTAQSVCDTANAGFSLRPQMIDCFNNATTLAPLATQSAGYASLSASLLSDGATFQVRAASLNQSASFRLYNAGPLGIPSGPITFVANGSGATKQVGPDTFKVWMDRGSTTKEGQPWEPFILAYQPGDSQYRPAFRPIYLSVAAPVNNISGTTQYISFASPPAQLATNLQTVTLNATATSGLPVQYWVVSGPYRNDSANSANLLPDTIPARATYPIKVVVGAWQWGSPQSPQYQSAAPVFQTFYIHPDAISAWRYNYFGTDSNTGAAADTADPDGDGLSNLLEYALGLNPTVADGAASVVQGTTADGSALTLTFNRIADPSLTYSVEAVDDLTQAWSPIWSSTGSENVAGSVTVQDTVPMSSQPARFLRLQVGH